jgi:hypothetical protein
MCYCFYFVAAILIMGRGDSELWVKTAMAQQATVGFLREDV